MVLSMMRALEVADPDPLGFDEQQRRRIFAEFVAHPSFGRAWIVLEGERAVGYAVLTLGFSFEYGGRDAFLDELYVDEKYRGRGIGRQTMDFVTEQAKEMGVNAVHLEATRENETAIGLYRSAGYFVHQRFLMTRRLTR